MAKYWVQNGASPSKLNIGVGTFGRSFTLVNPSQTGLGAAARQAGNAGQYTRENGFLAYYEVTRLEASFGAWSLGECLTIHSPPAPLFFFFLKWR